MKNKELGTNCINIMENQMEHLDTVYKVHKSAYECEVIRIFEFVISYLTRKTCEKKQGAHKILIYFTRNNTIRIGIDNELPAFHSSNSVEFEETFDAVIDFLEVSEKFVIHKSETNYKNALKAFSITYRP